MTPAEGKYFCFSRKKVLPLEYIYFSFAGHLDLRRGRYPNSKSSSDSKSRSQCFEQKAISCHGYVDVQGRTVEDLSCYASPSSSSTTTTVAAVGSHNKGADRFRLWTWTTPNTSLAATVTAAREQAREQAAAEAGGGVEVAGGSTSVCSCC